MYRCFQRALRLLEHSVARSGDHNALTIFGGSMQVGDLVKYKNTMSKKYGIVLEHGDYAFACDVFVYWFNQSYASGERTGDLAVLTST